MKEMPQQIDMWHFFLIWFVYISYTVLLVLNNVYGKKKFY